ncbi:DUF2971 domain-containing protein [Bradyrhizobium sp. B124]|uniref:DUF2971 domain-containing protein n=1 Tax=Bradyrhizobium sp. B124 TaxID=3140245 RepID=UPI003182DF31
MIESQRIIDRVTIGLCCFTELNNSPGMSWHYANNHTGVCLEFDASPDLIRKAVPITYAAHPPVLNINA